MQTQIDFQQMWEQTAAYLSQPYCLRDMFEGYPYADDEISSWHQRSAEVLLDDLLRDGWIPGGFIGDMMRRQDDGRDLTDRMVRGVLNCAGGAIKANRARFWKSRGRRKDRFDGEPCVICGGPLSDPVAVALGCGAICYQRIIDHLLRFV